MKGAIRSRQLAMSRNRMIASVADADVVVVNPTHVAVALTYVAGEGAPKLVAKGKNLVAQRIREEAEAHDVPLVRDIPLARALNAHCEIGHPIPLHFLLRSLKSSRSSCCCASGVRPWPR